MLPTLTVNPIRFDPKERYSKYGDYKTFPINPRWEPTFKAALLQPVGRRENWLVAEDIMATMQGLSDEQVEELSNTPEKDEKISATFEWGEWRLCSVDATRGDELTGQ